MSLPVITPKSTYPHPPQLPSSEHSQLHDCPTGNSKDWSTVSLGMASRTLLCQFLAPRGPPDASSQLPVLCLIKMDVFSNNTQDGYRGAARGQTGAAESRYHTVIDRCRPSWPSSSSRGRHNINKAFAEPFLLDKDLCAGKREEWLSSILVNIFLICKALQSGKIAFHQNVFSLPFCRRSTDAGSQNIC